MKALPISLALAVAAGLSVAAVATAAPRAAAPIKIGFAIAKTGGFSTYDLSIEASAQIRVNEINAKGGLLGRKLEIIDVDTKSDLNQSANAAKELLAKGADFMVSTADYDFGGPAARAAVQAGKPAFGFAGDPLWGYHGIGPLAFNLYQNSFAEGAVMAEFAYSKGWRKAAILTDTINSYPRTVTTNFEKRFKELGGKIASKDLFLNSDPSVQTQTTRIKTSGADFVVVASFPPGGASAIKQIRSSGIALPIVGDEAFEGTYWLGAVPGLSNFFLPVLAYPNGLDPDPARRAFFKKYKKATGKESILGVYPVSGYSAVQLIELGVKAAGTIEGKQVAAAIAGMKDAKLLVGKTNYAARKNCNIPQGRPFLLFEVQNGKAKFVKFLSPKKVPAFKC